MRLVIGTTHKLAAESVFQLLR